MGRLWGEKANVTRLRVSVAVVASAVLAGLLAQRAPEPIRGPATQLARLALPISSIDATTGVAECDEAEETIATGWSTITLPRRCVLSACEPLRPARVLAARIADDETYLALARRHRANGDDAVWRRVQALETLLARHLARHAELAPRCRAQVDAWLERERERRSSYLYCDPSYDPLCCP